VTLDEVGRGFGCGSGGRKGGDGGWGVHGRAGGRGAAAGSGGQDPPKGTPASSSVARLAEGAHQAGAAKVVAEVERERELVPDTDEEILENATPLALFR